MARSLCKPSLSDASREVSLQPLSHDTGSGDDERRFWDQRPLSEPDTDLRDISWFILLRFNCHLHGLSKKRSGYMHINVPSIRKATFNLPIPIKIE